MNPCKECIVDVICIKECPIFTIDLDRFQTDEEIYLQRCMNNIRNETYQVSENIQVRIINDFVSWYKNGKRHRDNDQPAVIFYHGTRHWYKNGKRHRDNNQPTVIFSNETSIKNGVRYEPM